MSVFWDRGDPSTDPIHIKTYEKPPNSMPMPWWYTFYILAVGVFFYDLPYIVDWIGGLWTS